MMVDQAAKSIERILDEGE